VLTCVSAVYAMLVSAAREAAAVAGEHTEAAMSGKVPLNVPEFKNFIMPAIVRALDEWRLEAEKSARAAGRGRERGREQRPRSSSLWCSAPRSRRPRAHAPPLCHATLQCPRCWWTWSAPTSPRASSGAAGRLLLAAAALDATPSKITSRATTDLNATTTPNPPTHPSTHPPTQRYTMYRRYAAMQQQSMLQQALHKGQAAQGKRKGLAGLIGGGGSTTEGQVRGWTRGEIPAAARGSGGGVS
jgi:hypothetical protein